MRFSIRTLLALTLLVALATLAWRNFVNARQTQVRQYALRAEVEQLQQILDRRRQNAGAARLSESVSLQRLEQQARDHFDSLLEEYRKIEPRPPRTVSLRTLPGLPGEHTSAPSVFRFVVPEQRPVWLKAAVHPPNTSINDASQAEKADPLEGTAFVPSGPFEAKLDPGVHELSITRHTANEEGQRISVQYDGRLFFETLYAVEEVRSGSSSSISAPTQLDFGPSRSLPWLMTLKSRVRGQTSMSSPGIAFWLSDQSNGFKEFPEIE